MNKVLNINLGGMPFTIDEEAYRILEDYLQTLHNHFRASDGYEEIMGDIESRLAELMREGMGKRMITGAQDVRNAISVMGKPEDFGAEPITEGGDAQEQASSQAQTSAGSSSSNSSGATIKTGKRLFRDPDNKQISGVCAGIAAYFGISDPTWVRLAYIGLVFFGGTGVWLYVILSFVIPEAKTSSEKLSMRGEPIDVNSIAKVVEEGVEKFSQKVNSFGKSENQDKFNRTFAETSGQISSTIGYILRGLGGFGKVIGIIVAVSLIIALIASWVSAAIGFVWAAPVVGYLTDKWWLAGLTAFNVAAILAVPTIAIALAIRRLIFGRDVSGAWHGVMWAFFGLSIASLSIIGGISSKQFRSRGEVVQTIKPTPQNDVLTVNVMFEQRDEMRVQLGDLHLTDDQLLSNSVRLDIQKSNDDQWVLTERLASRGRNASEARTAAAAIQYPVKVENGTVVLPREFVINKGEKWRGQNVRLTLRVPVGKRIKMNIDAQNFANYEESDDSDCARDEDQIWEMTSNGSLKCVSAKKSEGL